MTPTNRTAVPTDILSDEKGLRLLLRSALSHRNRTEVYRIFRSLHLRELFHHFLRLLDAYVLIAENGIPNLRIGDMSREEVEAMTMWQMLRDTDGEDLLSFSLGMLHDVIAAQFPVQADSPGQPIPMPKEGELEALWLHVLESEDSARQFCSLTFGVLQCEFQEQLLGLVRRIQKLQGRGIFDNETQAEAKYERWFLASLHVLSRAWPLVFSLDLIGDVLTNPLSNQDRMMAAQATISNMGPRAAPIEERLLAAFGEDGPRTRSGDPEWYVDDIPDEYWHKAVLWECLCSISETENASTET